MIIRVVVIRGPVTLQMRCSGDSSLFYNSTVCYQCPNFIRLISTNLPINEEKLVHPLKSKSYFYSEFHERMWSIQSSSMKRLGCHTSHLGNGDKHGLVRFVFLTKVPTMNKFTFVQLHIINKNHFDCLILIFLIKLAGIA
jgi:hypothetical protein